MRVGLRYTVTCVPPSSLMFTQASRKGNLLSCSGSVVNLMLSSRLLRWYSWITVNVSSMYLNYTEGGGVGAVRRAISSNSSIYWFAIMGDTSDPMAAPCFCLYIYLFIYLLCHIYPGVRHQCAALFSLGSCITCMAKQTSISIQSVIIQ